MNNFLVTYDQHHFYRHEKSINETCESLFE